MENIVAKGEIACFEQFLLLALCFPKAVCCRGVRKPLYEEKGLMKTMLIKRVGNSVANGVITFYEPYPFCHNVSKIS